VGTMNFLDTLQRMGPSSLLEGTEPCCFASQACFLTLQVYGLRYRLSLQRIKVKLTLKQAAKAQRWSIYSSTLPLTSALYRGGWSTLRPGRFTPKKDPVSIA
jgi:hypothetical protein